MRVREFTEKLPAANKTTNEDKRAASHQNDDDNTMWHVRQVKSNKLEKQHESSITMGISLIIIVVQNKDKEDRRLEVGRKTGKYIIALIAVDDDKSYVVHNKFAYLWVHQHCHTARLTLQRIIPLCVYH